MAKKTVLFVADEDNLNEQFICDGDVSLDNCYQKSMEGVIKYEKLEGYDDSLTVKNGVLVNDKGEILSHREDDYISVVCSMEPCCTYVQRFVIDCPEDTDSVWFVGEIFYDNLPEFGEVKRVLEGKVYLTEEEARQAYRDQFNKEIELAKRSMGEDFEDWFSYIDGDSIEDSDSYDVKSPYKRGVIYQISKENASDWIDDYLNDPWEGEWVSYEEDCNREGYGIDDTDKDDDISSVCSQPEPKEEPTFLNFLKDALQSNAIMGLEIEEE